MLKARFSHPLCERKEEDWIKRYIQLRGSREKAQKQSALDLSQGDFHWFLYNKNIKNMVSGSRSLKRR
jgi:hypothetical protein